MSYHEICPNILEQVKCSYCQEVVSFGPVYVSSKGNHVCGRCEPRKESEEEVFLRNTYFEKIAASFKFPCKNKILGCVAVLGGETLKSHEEYCNFGRKSCVSLMDYKKFDFSELLATLQKTPESGLRY